MEDAVLTGLHNTKTKEDEGSSGHTGANRPVPIRTADGDGNGGGLSIHHVGVDIERIVSLLEVRRHGCGDIDARR